MPNQPIQFLIGVDIGGTFTDIVVIDQIAENNLMVKF